MKYTNIVLEGGEASKVILRSFSHGKTVIKTTEHGNIKKEAAILRLLAKNGVAVPRVRSVRGKNLFLEYIPGKNLSKVKINGAIIKKTAAAFRKMHSIKRRFIGKLDAPLKNTPENWTKFMNNRMKKELQRTVKHGFLGIKTAQQLEEKGYGLARKGIRPFKPTLVHSDLHLDNIRITPTGKIFLLDFENPFLGDELYDFAPLRYFHPSLYPKIRKSYSPELFANEKNAMRWYAFLHAIEIGTFYAGIGKRQEANKAFRVARAMTKEAKEKL